MSDIDRAEFLRRSLGLVVVAAMPAGSWWDDVDEPCLILQVYGPDGVLGVGIIPMVQANRVGNDLLFTLTIEAEEYCRASGVRYRVDWGSRKPADVADDAIMRVTSEWRERGYAGGTKVLYPHDTLETTLTLSFYDEGEVGPAGDSYRATFPLKTADEAIRRLAATRNLLPPGSAV